jgi:hypothetical protein
MPSRKDKSSRSRKRGRKSDKSRSRKRTKESRRRSALQKLHSMSRSEANKRKKWKNEENRMYKRILQDAGLISRTGKRLF